MKRVALAALAAIAALAVSQGGAVAEADTPPMSTPGMFAPSLMMHVMGVATAAETGTHRLLVDVHSEADVTCVACHGEVLTDPVDEAVCTDCHGSYDEIAAMTPWEPNPHDSHLGEIPCTTCHLIHEPSVSFCDMCHSFGMQVP